MPKLIIYTRLFNHWQRNSLFIFAIDHKFYNIHYVATTKLNFYFFLLLIDLCVVVAITQFYVKDNYFFLYNAEFKYMLSYQSKNIGKKANLYDFKITLKNSVFVISLAHKMSVTYKKITFFFAIALFHLLEKKPLSLLENSFYFVCWSCCILYSKQLEEKGYNCWVSVTSKDFC